MGLKKGLLNKGILVAGMCLGLVVLVSYDAKADTTVKTTQGIVLKTSELKVEKVIVAPKQEVKKSTQKSNGNASKISRGGNLIVNTALSFIGKPYVYGATGPNAFDCSGLTKYVFAKHGISIPRTSSSQYNVGVSISRNSLQPGDLVFFNTYGSISHVGIYIGGGDFVHAPTSGKNVMISSLNEGYYKARYVGAKRVN